MDKRNHGQREADYEFTIYDNGTEGDEELQEAYLRALWCDLHLQDQGLVAHG